jgi:hypothetical protein
MFVLLKDRTIGITRGLEWGRGRRVMRGKFWFDGTILYLVCGRRYITLHICQTQKSTPKRVNFTVCKLKIHINIF